MQTNDTFCPLLTRLCVAQLVLVVMIVAGRADEPAPIAPDWIRLEKSETSLGMLVQNSEAIARVTIISRQSIEGTEDVKFALKVEHPLWGDPPSEVRRSLFVLAHAPELPDEGAHGILFMSKQRLEEHPIGIDSMTIDPGAHDLGIWRWRIMGSARGFIQGTSSDLRDVQYAIDNYIRWYRAKASTAFEHAQFLASLWDHPNDRIREDIHIDTLKFRRELSSEQRAELMTMEGFPEVIRKTWMDLDARVAASIEAGRLAMIEAEKAKKIRTREEVEADFEQANWREAVQSAEREQLIRALRFLSSIRPSERVEHADLWAPALRELLEHGDFPVRIMAARHLSMIGDRSAVPVLLDLLRSGQRGEKSAADMLRQISGEPFPFDPNAPPEEKEAQIRAWEEWWEMESANSP